MTDATHAADGETAPVTRQATVHSFDTNRGEGTVITDDGVVIGFGADAWRASQLLTLREGQRLRVRVIDDSDGPRITWLTLVTFPG